MCVCVCVCVCMRVCVCACMCVCVRVHTDQSSQTQMVPGGLELQASDYHRLHSDGDSLEIAKHRNLLQLYYLFFWGSFIPFSILPHSVLTYLLSLLTIPNMSHIPQCT